MALRSTVENLLFRYGDVHMRARIARRWGVRVGEETRLGRVSFGSEPYLITIGTRCQITDGVCFITHDGGTWVLRHLKGYFGSKFGTITIGDNVFIGLNAILLPGVTIGSNAVIGAGSVVTGPVPEGCVAAGNPARQICSIDEYFDRCLTANPGDLGTGSPESRGQKEAILKHFFPNSERQ
jgi:acetyltransferase-like isoleucine patch superfamily enzyme